MQVELRKVQINRRLSEETTAFSADVYVDGEKVGVASNRGTGGPNDVFFTVPGVRERFDAYLKTLPPEPSEFVEGGLTMDDDLFIGLLLEKEEEKQMIQRAKKKTHFRLKSKPMRTGEWLVIAEAFTPELKAYLVRKYGDDLQEIGNETYAK